VLGSAIQNINVLIETVYERAKIVTKIEQFLGFENNSFQCQSIENEGN